MNRCRAARGVQMESDERAPFGSTYVSTLKGTILDTILGLLRSTMIGHDIDGKHHNLDVKVVLL